MSSMLLTDSDEKRDDCASRPLPENRPAAGALLVAASLLLCASAQAADWSLVPSLGVNETYTNNVNLQPEGLAKSDFVSQITPGFTATTNGPNLTFNGYYGLQKTYYANGNAANSSSNLLNANAKATFIKNLLFLDSSASITQQNISAFGAQPVDNTSASTNRTTVRTTHISPYLSHAFDTDATSELRYARDTVSASAGGLSSSVTDTVSFKADSGTAFREIGWGLAYSDATTHYQDEGNVAFENVVGKLSYLLAPHFRLVGTTGYDSNNYSTLGSATSGASWSGGFEWTVSDRTSLSASVGHKYYGNSYSLNAATRSRMANWTLSYDESVTTTPQQFSLPGSINTAAYLDALLSPTITDTVARTQAVNQLIQQSGLPSTLTNAVNSFTNAVFLQKQLQAAVLLTSNRTTLLLSLFDIQRVPLSSNELSALIGVQGTTVQVGASAVLSRSITPLLRFNTSLVASRVTSDATGAVYNTQTVHVGFTKQLSPKLTGTVEVRRNQGQSNQVDTDYHEDAISAFFNLQL